MHSVVPEKIEVLNDHCIGYEEDNYGIVGTVHYYGCFQVVRMLNYMCISWSI